MLVIRIQGTNINYRHITQPWDDGVTEKASALVLMRDATPDDTGVVHKNFSVNARSYQIMYTYTCEMTEEMLTTLANAVLQLRNGAGCYGSFKIDRNHYASLFDMDRLSLAH